MKRKILFIGGSLNQTSMMHKISTYFTDADIYFSPYYADGFVGMLTKWSMLNWTVLGGAFFESTCDYIKKNNLRLDYGGKKHDYDLIYLSSDLIVPKNIRAKKVILVQEGMTDPENLMFYLVKYLKLPRYLASTSTTGMSNMYKKFCVASEGYKELFISKGVDASKIVITGIPNFDHCAQFLDNDFPHKGFALVATSDARETFKLENRKRFIKEAVKLSKGKNLIFKLHPNEKWDRAYKEIKDIVPDAEVYQKENINPMIANCDILITKYSTVVYIGLALGKEVHSYFDLNMLKRLLPIQNGGISAENIANVGKQLLEEKE